MAQITNIITIHEYNKMTAEQRAALCGENLLAVVQQDWEEVRIQASIAAMQAQLSSFETMESITKRAREHNLTVQEAVATLSVDYADALIAELQNKGGQNENN